MDMFKMVRYYQRHHKNAWFDMVAYVSDPENHRHLPMQIRESLKSFIKRTHRHVIPKHIKDEDFERTTVFVPGRGVKEVTTTPLDPEFRRHSGNFIWQRDPYRPVTMTKEDPRYETSGLSITLVYWMGRYYGIFK